VPYLSVVIPIHNEGRAILRLYDIDSGWREERNDNPLMRKAPPAIANWLMSKVSGLPRRDHQGRQPLRRTAPLHSGAGQLLWRQGCGSAHRQPAARRRQAALRNRADDQRLLRRRQTTISPS